jgi:DNA-binding transcriptional ArsR family regulator
VLVSSDRAPLASLRVLAHPLRLRLLSLLGGAAYSAAEAARELGETQANVSYHLRRLQQAGLVDVVEHASIRGGRAKRYRHDPTSGERLVDDDAGHLSLAITMAGESQRRATERKPGTPTAFTDAEFALEPADWDRARTLARELGILLADAARPVGTPGTVLAAATVSLFELNEPRR